MPARIASTPSQEQIKEVVGSGPFKFVRDEWQPGEQVVYEKNSDYIPRPERINWRQTRKDRKGNLALRPRSLRGGGVTQHRRGGLVAGTSHRLYAQAPTTP